MSNAILTFPDPSESQEKGLDHIQLPILPSTLGCGVVDVRKVHSETGFFTYDPGFTSTASCESAITYIDGDEGLLLHRGYPIEELAEHSHFLEVAYLLVYGDLPSPQEMADFQNKINNHSMVHEQLKSFYQGFRRDSHPMAIMVGVVGALSAFYPDSLNIHDPHQRQLATLRLIAKMPTMAAMAYRYSDGHPFVFPQSHLSYADNLLNMLFSVPSRAYHINPVFSKALDHLLILHADHEQNASTSTVRVAGSSGANPFACIASGIACLWGPAHGGANEAVLQMLMAIGTPDRIPHFIRRAKDPQDSFRLMGFGHRVYKNYDPRAAILKKRCHEVLRDLGRQDDPLLSLAQELEKIALEDDYFVRKRLYPNVDFYSGLILKALGIPPSMFTVFFALARTVGWIAHWNEMITDPQQKICRPRQRYVGHTLRHYPPTSKL